jgi:hypothetical protein
LRFRSLVGGEIGWKEERGEEGRRSSGPSDFGNMFLEAVEELDWFGERIVCNHGRGSFHHCFMGFM